MVKTLLAIFRTARPLQWLKNFTIFAPLIFSGALFKLFGDGTPHFLVVLQAFLVFCLLTSSTYFINDILDAKRDRAHPFKKKRPIAAGDLSVQLAWVVVGISLTAVVVVICVCQLSTFFRILCLAYVILQVLYTLWLKNVAILDVIAIAAFFVLRIYAGAAAVNVRINSWFLLTVIAIALFLAVGKRRSELTLLTNQHENLNYTRATLARYNEKLLDQYIGMFSTATWVSWALFTFQFQFSETTEKLFIVYADAPPILFSEKLLMITIPLVILGVMRYLQVIYEGHGESPERVLIGDKFLIGLVAVTMVLIVLIIYASVFFSVDTWPFKIA